MSRKSKTYSVKIFSSSSDDDYIEALDIYSSHTPLSVKTDTSDISYWIDRYNKEFEDRFFVFGLYEDESIIGFSQLVYFKQARLVMIDYMAIDEKRRANSAFYSFTDLIRCELRDLKLDINFIITEIEYDLCKKKPTENGTVMIRLLKQSGFGVLKAEYFQPKLGFNNTESAPCAVLMIDVRSSKDSITKESYLKIVNTIYFNHYLRWYTPILKQEELACYKQELDELYTKIVSALSNKNKVDINGYKSIFDSQAPVDLEKKGLNFGTFSFIIILLVTASIMALAKYFGASMIEVILSVLISAAIFFLLNSISTGRGLVEFEKLWSVIKLFGKNK